MSAQPSAPRVRFAPSPTGYLHVGGARTALFNWIFARRHGGTFMLRIEDTDPERSRDDLIDGILRSMHWLRLEWDEGPVRQSTRLHRYLEVAQKLWSDGLAYYCECTAEDVKARAGGVPDTGYDGYCRDRDLGPGARRALRFRTPDEGETVVHDLIRGEVHFGHDKLEDFVIVRSDRSPSFYLPNAVDDVDQSMTHVIRGDDLLAATPRVLLVRKAMGVTDVPVFAHLPMIVDEQRRRLSKRKHSVAVEEYRAKGYLPDALRNYLALLGWSPPDGREIMPIEDMVAEFDPADVNRSAAFFDMQKLDHVNAEYIRALPVATFVRESLPWLELDAPWPPECFDLGKFEEIAAVVQERVRTLSDVPNLVDFLFLEEPEIDEVSWTKAMRHPAAGPVLKDALAEYADCPWDASALRDVTLAIGERHQLKLAKAQAPIRVAVTGRAVGPPLFESLHVLGREQALKRLGAAIERLESVQQ